MLIQGTSITVTYKKIEGIKKVYYNNENTDYDIVPVKTDKEHALCFLAGLGDFTLVDENFINELLSYNIMNEDFRIVIETDYELDEELFNSFSIKKLKYGRSLMYVLRRL